MRKCCSDLHWATVHQRHLLLTRCQAYKIINNPDCLQFDNVLANLLLDLIDLHCVVQVPVKIFFTSFLMEY